MKLDPPQAPRLVVDDEGRPIHVRIRWRRRELGIKGYALAKLVGISPSYISLIEKGVKIPDEAVALRIARTLRDDPELYLAWTHSKRYENLDEALESAELLQRYVSDPHSRATELAYDDTHDGATAPRSAPLASARQRSLLRQRRLAGDEAPTGTRSDILRGMFGHDDASAAEPATVPVPLLRDGADPGDDPPSSGAVRELLQLDPRVLPGGAAGEDRLFAYRPSSGMTRRVRDVIDPGDLVVLTTRVGRFSTDQIHAVRLPGREPGVVLGRVIFKDSALVLLPGIDESDLEVLDTRKGHGPEQFIAGTVIATVRAH